MYIFRLSAGLLVIVVFWCFLPREYVVSGVIMGTTYKVKYINKNIFFFHEKKIASAIDNVLHIVDNSMSTYKNSSELMQFNNWAVGEMFDASEPLYKLLSVAVKLSEMSEGAYDVTIGNLVNIWGFGPNAQKMVNIPKQEIIDKIKNEVGYQYLQLNPHTLQITKLKNLFVDLSSIAKGYGVDQVANKLEKSGIDNYMVEVGGEITAKGKGLYGNPWRVAILMPDKNFTARMIILQNMSLATSGDYLNYYNINNQCYSHGINPFTGFPKDDNIASVTVIATNAMMADAYSTMFMVLDREKGQKIAIDNNLAVYIIYRNQGLLSEFASPKFSEYLPRGI